MALVLVVGHQRRPGAPAHPGRARHLLTRGRTAGSRRFPFTLIWRDGEPSEEAELLRLKIDPGSQTTGLAVVNDATGQAVRASGSCNVKTARETIEGIPVRYCQPLQRGDGYTYATGAASPGLTAGVSAPRMRSSASNLTGSAGSAAD